MPFDLGVVRSAGGLARGCAVRTSSVEAPVVVRTLKEQATSLVKQDGGKARATLRSPSTKVEIDLVGKGHNSIPTPHTKVSPLNPMAPNQPAYNTKSAEVLPATQEDIRMARRYLEKSQ